MIKIILYTLILVVGGYYTAGYVPDSVKDKFVSAAGLLGIKEKSFNIFNPAAKRADILQKLETNVSKLEVNSLNQEETDSVIAESKALLAEMQELNTKTGVLPGVVAKVFGVDPNSQVQQTITIDQITPELKQQICK